jgi:hypothetical protein
VQAKLAEYDAYQAYLEAVRDYWLARVELARAVGQRLPSDAGIGERTPSVQDILAPKGGMDHSTMDHSQHGAAAPAAMDHSGHEGMDHSKHEAAPPKAMDHSGHDGMDHSKHEATAPEAMDHSGHEGMDHSKHEAAPPKATNHSGHEGMDHSGHDDAEEPEVHDPHDHGDTP